MLDAALAGHGIALGKLRLAQADLAAGRLVVPFGAARDVGHAYHFVATPARQQDRRVKAFRRWMLGEAALIATAANAFPREDRSERTMMEERVRKPGAAAPGLPALPCER